VVSGTRWEGKEDICDVENNMAVYGTDSLDQVESLWVKCEGCQTWWLTKGLKQKLPVFINKRLRNILWIWWPGRIWNEELWRQAGQWTAEQEITQRAWGWIGHMLRKPDRYIANSRGR